MLRKIRIALALPLFVAVTLLFLDFTGTVHAWLGWTAGIQFLPALLAMNFGVVLALMLMTLLIGRVYCSVICPMGVMQDVISWLSGRSRRRRKRFSYSPAVSWLRYGVLALFVVAMIAGVGSFVALLAPYSSYGRIAANLFAPIWRLGNNLLAYFAERADSYAFYSTDVWIRSIPVFVIAVVTFVAVAILAWRGGRTYCNTVCPVGTFLGFISRFSIFAPVIDISACNSCTLCSRRCKSSCIDAKNHRIDYSRCVACMDCIDTCAHGAISLGLRSASQVEQASRRRVSTSRRSFLSASAIVVGTTLVKAQEKIADGGLAAVEAKKVPGRATRIVPPGAVGLRHLETHCTGCQLCVSACPEGVLRPSAGLMTLMQPEASYERGYCRPECTRCSEVCPAGAILPVSVAEKSSIQIGHAVWIRANCIPLTDGVECGNCARHCPAGAIAMILSDKDNPEAVRIPVVDTERCIGCGACENLCPSRPFSAIYVEGHERHRTI